MASKPAEREKSAMLGLLSGCSFRFTLFHSRRKSDSSECGCRDDPTDWFTACSRESRRWPAAARGGGATGRRLRDQNQNQKLSAHMKSMWMCSEVD